MIRFIVVIALVIAVTLLLMPFQLISLACDLRYKRTIPQLYHRILCALIGVRIREVGRRNRGAPVLILSNHVSWLDICVISALAPVVFVSKSEVSRWPVFGWLAKLQRTIFIDRQARHRTGDATREIGGRLLGGDAVVLYAEGTSSDGVRILPFRPALIGAVHQALAGSGSNAAITVLAGICRVRRCAHRVCATPSGGMGWRCQTGPSSDRRPVVRRHRCHGQLGRCDGHQVRHGPQANRSPRRTIGTANDRNCVSELEGLRSRTVKAAGQGTARESDGSARDRVRR